MTRAVIELIKEAKELNVGAELISALEELGKDAKGSRSEFKELREIVEVAKYVKDDENVIEDEIIDDQIKLDDIDEVLEDIIEESSLTKYKNNRENAFAIAHHVFRSEEFSIDVSELNETDKKRLTRAEELKIITKV